MTPSGPAALARWAEVHRLAVAGRQADIARDTGNRVGRVWLRTSRFADVEALAIATLTLGPDAGSFYDRGWARRATGRPQLAVQDYQQALTLYRQADDRGNEAATLSNIGLVYDALGNRRQALDFYRQALILTREVGDRVGEATTLNNIGGVYDALGDREQALDFYRQALPIRREVGDRAGEATTLNNIGGIRFAQGDLAGAEQVLGEVLEIVRLVGDRATEAMVCFNRAVLLAQLGRVDEAVTVQHQAIGLAEQTRHPALERMRAFLVRLDESMRGEGEDDG